MLIGAYEQQKRPEDRFNYSEWRAAAVRRGDGAALLRVVSHGSRRGTAPRLSPFKELFLRHIQSRLVEFACREADAGLFDVVGVT